MVSTSAFAFRLRNWKNVHPAVFRTPAPYELVTPVRSTLPRIFTEPRSSLRETFITCTTKRAAMYMYAPPLVSNGGGV